MDRLDCQLLCIINAKNKMYPSQFFTTSPRMQSSSWAMFRKRSMHYYLEVDILIKSDLKCNLKFKRS